MAKPRIIPHTEIGEAGLASLLRYPQYSNRRDPEYELFPHDFDHLPLDTFVAYSHPGGDGWPHWVGRVVKPNDPSKPEYRDHLTPDKRLVYKFWQGGIAVRMLHKTVKQQGHPAAGKYFRYIIMPGMAGYAEMEGFKTQCDIRRAVNKPEVITTLLCHAITKQGFRAPKGLLT